MKSPPAPSPSGAFPRPSTTPERILPETKGNAYDAGYFRSCLLCRWPKLGPSFHYPHAPPPPHVSDSALVFPALKKPEFPFMAGDVTCLVIGGADMPAVTSLLAQVLDMASRLQWQPPEDLPRFEVRTRHCLRYLYVRSARVIHSVIHMWGLDATFDAVSHTKPSLSHSGVVLGRGKKFRKGTGRGEEASRQSYSRMDHALKRTGMPATQAANPADQLPSRTGADQRDSENYRNSFRICSWPEY